MPPEDDQPTPSGEPAPPSLGAVVRKVDADQIQHFTTRIKSAELQVGEHILAALQHDDTVAVITTVVADPQGGQRIVTAALDPALMQQVQELLQEAELAREEEVPCVGFHCYVRPKNEAST